MFKILVVLFYYQKSFYCASSRFVLKFSGIPPSIFHFPRLFAIFTARISLSLSLSSLSVLFKPCDKATVQIATASFPLQQKKAEKAAWSASNRKKNQRREETKSDTGEREKGNQIIIDR